MTIRTFNAFTWNCLTGCYMLIISDKIHFKLYYYLWLKAKNGHFQSALFQHEYVHAYFIINSIIIIL